MTSDLFVCHLIPLTSFSLWMLLFLLLWRRNGGKYCMTGKCKWEIAPVLSINRNFPSCLEDFMLSFVAKMVVQPASEVDSWSAASIPWTGTQYCNASLLLVFKMMKIKFHLECLLSLCSCCKTCRGQKEKQTTQKKSRLNVTPGKSISAEDLKNAKEVTNISEATEDAQKQCWLWLWGYTNNTIIFISAYRSTMSPRWANWGSTSSLPTSATDEGTISGWDKIADLLQQCKSYDTSKLLLRNISVI